MPSHSTQNMTARERKDPFQITHPKRNVFTNTWPHIRSLPLKPDTNKSKPHIKYEHVVVVHWPESWILLWYWCGYFCIVSKANPAPNFEFPLSFDTKHTFLRRSHSLPHYTNHICDSSVSEIRAHQWITT